MVLWRRMKSLKLLFAWFIVVQGGKDSVSPRQHSLSPQTPTNLDEMDCNEDPSSSTSSYVSNVEDERAQAEETTHHTAFHRRSRSSSSLSRNNHNNEPPATSEKDSTGDSNLWDWSSQERKVEQHSHDSREGSFCSKKVSKKQANDRQPSLSSSVESTSFSPHPQNDQADQTSMESPMPQNTESVTTTPKIPSDTSLTDPWVQKLLSCSAAQQEGLLPIPLDFWSDHFNLAQLAPVVEEIVAQLLDQSAIATPPLPPQGNQKKVSSFPLYRQALQLITSQRPLLECSNLEKGSSLDSDKVEVAATVLFCLVHQRYVQSPRGLQALRQKFQSNGGKKRIHMNNMKTNTWETGIIPLFGRCPRPSCRGMPLLPAGQDDYSLQQYSMFTTSEPRSSLRFCGKCHSYWVHYHDNSSTGNKDADEHKLDPCQSDTSLSSSKLSSFVQGCAWGQSLAPLFHLTFPDLLQPCGQHQCVAPIQPRIYGFPLHARALASSSYPTDLL